MSIHPLAVVHNAAQIGSDVSIGPFCVVEENVTIGDGCQLASSVVVRQGTTLGTGNQVCEGAILGGLPQHTRPPEKLGTLVVGSGNTIREYCTLHRALHEGATTSVGDNNLLMVGAHIAHDCHIGNRIIFANNALMAGHVTVEDRAFVSGAVAVHQFCRIGTMAMIGGHARVVQDVPPYSMVDGSTGLIVGFNLVGLRRNGFTADEINELKEAYRLIYRKGLSWNEILEELKTRYTSGAAAVYHSFFTHGTRGFVQERRMPPRVTLKLRSTSESEDEELRVPRSKAG